MTVMSQATESASCTSDAMLDAFNRSNIAEDMRDPNEFHFMQVTHGVYDEPGCVKNGKLVKPNGYAQEWFAIPLGVYVEREVESPHMERPKVPEYDVYNLDISTGSVIAPTAQVSPISKVIHSIVRDGAVIEDGARVTGYCDVGVGVTIGKGARVADLIQLNPGTSIGAGSRLDWSAAVGRRSQVAASTRVKAWAKLDQSCRVGERSRVKYAAKLAGRAATGREVQLGERSQLGAGSVIHSGAQIDNDATIGEHVRIGRDSYIGEWAVVREQSKVPHGSYVPSSYEDRAIVFNTKSAHAVPIAPRSRSRSAQQP